MSKNLKSKTAIRLKHFVYGRTHIYLLAIVNVTYVTQCYDIKSNTVVKSWKKKKKKKKKKNIWHTDKMVLYIFWSWLFVFPDKINFWSIQLFGIHDAVLSFDMVFTYWFMFLCYNSLSAFKLNSNFQYLSNKFRQSRRSEYNFGLISNPVAKTVLIRKNILMRKLFLSKHYKTSYRLATQHLLLLRRGKSVTSKKVLNIN